MAKLSGKWTLKAIGHNAAWQQRIVITGSNAHDGPHVMTLGASIPHVEGEDIEVTAQALNPVNNTWITSLVQEVMNWDNSTGLQVRLNIDDNPPLGDLDFNDLVVLCTAENAELASPVAGPRPDLTIPEKYLKRQPNSDPRLRPPFIRPSPNRNG
jgi:hypothetical protein